MSMERPLRRGDLGRKSPDRAGIEIVNRSPLFAGFTALERDDIAKRLRLRTTKKGDRVTAQGEVSEGLFLVGKGTFTVRAGGQDLATLRPGDHFGEMSIVYGTPRSANVWSVDAGEVWVLGADDLQDLMARNPGFRALLTVEAATRTAEHGDSDA